MRVGTRTILAALFGALVIGLLTVPQAQAIHDKESLVADRTKAMTVKDAKYFIGRNLASNYGGQWKNGEQKSIDDCYNVRSYRVKCKVSWVHGSTYYHGNGYAYWKPHDNQYGYSTTNIDTELVD